MNADYKNLTIAIDGPAGSGKSTAAKGLAKRLGLTYIDTGAMYRAVAWKVLKKEVSIVDESQVGEIAQNINIEFIHDDGFKKIKVDNVDVTELIREDRISEATSKISTYREVREAMTVMQRSYGENGGVVMEGRDIGTVVFPEAQFKFFIEASLEERAKRRFQEFRLKKQDVNKESILRAMSKRDERDKNRQISPLNIAKDAKKVDSTYLSIDELLDFMLKIIL